MSRKGLVKLIATVVLVFAIALSFFFVLRPYEMKVTDVNLGLGVEGNELEKLTDTFYENQYVSLTGYLSNPQDNIELYLECYDSDNQFVEPNDMTDETLTEEDLFTEKFVFSYFPKENKWTVDNYRMKVILNNKIVEVKEFEVVRSA